MAMWPCVTGQHCPRADSDETEKEVGVEGIISVCLLYLHCALKNVFFLQEEGGRGKKGSVLHIYSVFILYVIAFRLNGKGREGRRNCYCVLIIFIVFGGLYSPD